MDDWHLHLRDLAAHRRAEMVDFLPEEILQEIFLRLPLGALHQATKVCSKWKQVMESATFNRLYLDRARLLVKVHNQSVEITDRDKNTLRLENPSITFSRNRCPNTSLMTAYNEVNHKVHACNVISNKWEEVPRLPHKDLHRVGIFGLGNGHYKVVLWSRWGLWTFERGADRWVEVRAPGMDGLTHFIGPAMINTSMFYVTEKDGVLHLMEYNTLGKGTFSCRQITGTGERIFHDILVKLVVFEDELYMLTTLLLEGTYMWKVSAGSGAATLRTRLDLATPKGLICPLCFKTEDNRVLIRLDWSVTLKFNISTNSVEGFIDNINISPELAKVMLYNQ